MFDLSRFAINTFFCTVVCAIIKMVFTLAIRMNTTANANTIILVFIVFFYLDFWFSFLVVVLAFLFLVSNYSFFPWNSVRYFSCKIIIALKSHLWDLSFFLLIRPSILSENSSSKLFDNVACIWCSMFSIFQPLATHLYTSGGGSYGKVPICFWRTSVSKSVWFLAGIGDDVSFGCVINRLSVSENDWAILVELLCLVS